MKWINKISLRKLRINDKTFLWKRVHYHLDNFEYSECVEKVIIYLEGYKNASLQLLFREEDNLLLETELKKWCVGYPDTGVIWLLKPKEKDHSTYNISINLNRPAVITKFIEHYFDKEWKPKKSNKPLIIENALLILEKIELPQGIN